MSFITDKQTLDDLNVTGKYRPDSVFSLFNKVSTDGGEKLLDKLFQEPLTDPEQINERSSVFYFFSEKQFVFPFTRTQFGAVENYLSGIGSANLVSSIVHVHWKKLLAAIVSDEEYRSLHDHLHNTINVLSGYMKFIEQLDAVGRENDNLMPLHFKNYVRSVNQILQHQRLSWLKEQDLRKRIPAISIARYDHLLRSVLHDEMNTILESVYRIDVYMAVGNVAKVKGLGFAHALPREENILSAVNLRHPCLEKAIGNPVSFHQHDNVLFLTGANMAGKSTFMKSFGIAVYLGHMGFPIAAKEMKFSVKQGIYTSINVPDNLSLGYSHFYAEVLRVKKVAQEIASSKDLFIIFDELFKGTNVKDAYDATLEVTAAFAENRNCFFIISTHITEAGDQLRLQTGNVQFVYFPSILNNNKPAYTYKLQQGISSDRHGMMILENEGIVELITG